MLVAVGVPFVVFTTVLLSVVESSIAAENAEFFLRNKASDVADKINLALRERRQDLQLWVTEPIAVAALRDPDDEEARSELRHTLDLFCKLKDVYDLLAVVDRSGRLIAWNSVDAEGTRLAEHRLRRLAGADLYRAPWFQRALAGETVPVDWHLDPLRVADVSVRSTEPSDYSVGFAAPIRDPEGGAVLGVWYSLMGWSSLQEQVLDRVQDYFRDLSKNRQFQSGYAFLWMEDANVVIAHPNRALYGTRVAGPPVNLPNLHVQVRANPNRVVHYDYEGKRKRAAFRQTLGRAEGGFGWIVGVGVEDEQIFAPTRQVGTILLIGAVAGLIALLLWILIISRTVSRPLAALTAESERIAMGDLDARVQPAGPAETVALAHAFNRMAEDLARSRSRLVRAEKEAAWREMARQVSHEIKNPLTPMKLSISLLERAWRDRAPEFDTILARALATIDRQIESLRRIAADFRAFAGAPERRSERVSLERVLEDSASLYAAIASERGVRIHREGSDLEVLGDPEEIRRAVVNLLDNAMQAAPPDSEIGLVLGRENGFARIDVRDRGPGVPPELREKLFTPYFSTRTHGTGLGLAIVRRIVEDHGGTVILEDSVTPDGAAAVGTTMVVRLPLLVAAAPATEHTG